MAIEVPGSIVLVSMTTVSGGPEGAKQGTLAVMVGGDRQAYDRCLPVLQRIGRSLFYLGPSGSGQKMKLVNQTLAASYAVLSAEAYLWSRSMGVNLEDMISVISRSWGDSPVFRRCMELIKSGDLSQDGAPIRLIEKDLAIILKDAKKERVPMPLTERAHEVVSRAIDDGNGNRGIASLPSLISTMMDKGEAPNG